MSDQDHAIIKNAQALGCPAERCVIRRIYLHSGYVKGSDGDIHFIPASRLVELYKLNQKMHNIVIMSGIESLKSKGWARGRCDIDLYPKQNGDYTYHAL